MEQSEVLYETCWGTHRELRKDVWNLVRTDCKQPKFKKFNIEKSLIELPFILKTWRNNI
jgi:hypothetical protein